MLTQLASTSIDLHYSWYIYNGYCYIWASVIEMKGLPRSLRKRHLCNPPPPPGDPGSASERRREGWMVGVCVMERDHS